MYFIPHTIEDIYEELDAADVQTTISISEDLPEPVVNAGRAGKDELKSQNINLTFDRDRKSPCTNPIHKKNENWDENRNKVCKARGFCNRKLHKIMKKIHNGNPKECMLRGPAYNKDKQMRERLNQFNLKNKDGKAPLSEDRMTTPPQDATIPKANHGNIAVDSDSDNDEEDNIQEGYYSESEMDNDMLPQPSVIACKISPKTNSSLTENSKIYPSIGTENMIKISSFWLKLE